MTPTPTVTSESDRLEQIERELADVKRDEAFRRGEVWPERPSKDEIAARQEKALRGRAADTLAKSEAIERAERAERPERRKLDGELARIAAERRTVEGEIVELQAKVARMTTELGALRKTQFESDRLRQIHPSRFRDGVPQ
jgi:chromosome segregation ATPase